MILVIDNGNGSYAINHFPERLGKTEEELREMGVLLESIPIAEEIIGKEAILKFDGTQLYYEYMDIPLTLEEQLAEKSKQIKTLEIQQKQLNDDLLAFMDYVTTGGM